MLLINFVGLNMWQQRQSQCVEKLKCGGTRFSATWCSGNSSCDIQRTQAASDFPHWLSNISTPTSTSPPPPFLILDSHFRHLFTCENHDYCETYESHADTGSHQTWPRSSLRWVHSQKPERKQKFSNHLFILMEGKKLEIQRSLVSGLFCWSGSVFLMQQEVSPRYFCGRETLWVCLGLFKDPQVKSLLGGVGICMGINTA